MSLMNYFGKYAVSRRMNPKLCAFINLRVDPIRGYYDKERSEMTT